MTTFLTPQTQNNRTPVQGYPVGTGHQVSYLGHTHQSGREQVAVEPRKAAHVAGVHGLYAIQQMVAVGMVVIYIRTDERHQALDQYIVARKGSFFVKGQLDQSLGRVLSGTHENQTVKVKNDTPTIGCTLFHPEGQFRPKGGQILGDLSNGYKETGYSANIQRDLTKSKTVAQNDKKPMTIADIQGLYVLATILPRAAWYYCPTLAGRVSQYFFVLFFLSFFCFSPALPFGQPHKTPNTGIAKGYPATVLVLLSWCNQCPKAQATLLRRPV